MQAPLGSPAVLYRSKVVRDLAWVMSCPHLLARNDEMPALDDAWCRDLLRESEPWLAELDAEPSRLLGYFGEKRFSGRLGMYFGELLSWWVRHCPLLASEDLAVNLQIKSGAGNKTIGALKYAFRTLRGRPPGGVRTTLERGGAPAALCPAERGLSSLHWEASVKFFLLARDQASGADAGASASQSGPPPPLHRFVGPFLKENLAWRVHVAKRKLALCGCTAVREGLTQRWGPSLSTHFVLRGWLFYEVRPGQRPPLPMPPAEEQEAVPPTKITESRVDDPDYSIEEQEAMPPGSGTPASLSSDHARGWWTTSLAHVLEYSHACCAAGRTDPAQRRFALLSKLYWLSPACATWQRGLDDGGEGGASSGGVDRRPGRQADPTNLEAAFTRSMDLQARSAAAGLALQLDGAPGVGIAPTPTMTEQELRAHVPRHFQATDAPLLVAELHPWSGAAAEEGFRPAFREVRRTFILKEGWDEGDLCPEEGSGAVSRKRFDSQLRTSEDDEVDAAARLGGDDDNEVYRQQCWRDKHSAHSSSLTAALDLTGIGAGSMAEAGALDAALSALADAVVGCEGGGGHAGKKKNGNARKRAVRVMQNAFDQWLRDRCAGRTQALLTQVVVRLCAVRARWAASVAIQVGHVLCAARRAADADDGAVDRTLLAELAVLVAAAATGNGDDATVPAVWLSFLLKAAQSFGLSHGASIELPLEAVQARARKLCSEHFDGFGATSAAGDGLVMAAADLLLFCGSASGCAEDDTRLIEWLLDRGNTAGAEQLAAASGHPECGLRLVQWFLKRKKADQARRCAARLGLGEPSSSDGGTHPTHAEPCLRPLALVDVPAERRVVLADIEVQVIADTVALQQLRAAVEIGVTSHCAVAGGGVTDCRVLCGMDVEWKPPAHRIRGGAAGPTGAGGAAGPASLLQLLLPAPGGASMVVLLDLLALCAIEGGTATGEFVAFVFQHERLVLSGFGLGGDLAKLKESYPALCWSLRASLELQDVVGAVLPRGAQQYGLSALAATCLGGHLDKDQQLSDWSRRPLTAAQVTYAALDAVVLPAIAARLCDDRPPALPPATAEAAASVVLVPQVHVLGAGAALSTFVRAFAVGGAPALGCAEVVASARTLGLPQGVEAVLLTARGEAIAAGAEVVAKTLGLLSGGKCIACVVALDARLDIGAVAASCGVSRGTLRFATADELVTAFGYAPGGLGPLGLRDQAGTCVLLDDATVMHNASVLIGAGEQGVVLPVPPDWLAAATSARVARISRSVTAPDTCR
jgi:prolyl-tRNA editing enzyme YbaK/EbsC (Cys-tRNA(Pro) deacylase)